MGTNPIKISVAIVDDHVLFANSLEKLINSFSGFEVLFHAKNGKDLQQKLEEAEKLPKIVLLDINMPVMDGYETAEWLLQNHPTIKVLALSMEDNERVILKMIRNGARGYLLKDIHPGNLRRALRVVMKKGYFHSEKVANTILKSIHDKEKFQELKIKENELAFIQLACSELTYKEIAEVMNLSPKTIEGYRQDIFNKLNIKTRVGLVIYALKNNLMSL